LFIGSSNSSIVTLSPCAFPRRQNWPIEIYCTLALNAKYNDFNTH